MSLTAIIALSLAVGTVLFVIALGASRSLEKSDRSKLFVDSLLKSAIFLIGISFGIVGYFSQSMSENITKDLENYNDALFSLDAFISQYEGAVANTRIDDDVEDGFPDLVHSCEYLKNACDSNYYSKSKIKAGIAEDLAVYLNSPYIEKFDQDFILFAMQKPALKTVIYPKQITEADDNQIWIVQDHDAIKEEMQASGKELGECEGALSNMNRSDEITIAASRTCFRAAIGACCTVLDANNHSLEVGSYAMKQHAIMCDVRNSLASSIRQAIKDPIVTTFFSDRRNELIKRLSLLTGSETGRPLSTCLSPPDDAN